MCCLFTCCGWVIDLIQRAWTFTMSCCISSAVCCAFTTASISGIALGYNYSLAEYIDLKETNVSVYIKRGVFDDEIADDIDWRRSGHMPVAGHIGENNLRTGPSENEESSSIRSGRRLDDSILESDNQNKFEGSLMRLTAKAPFSVTITTGVTSDLEMSEIMSKYPLGSIDQLKAIQSLINMRKTADARETTIKGMTPKSTYGFDAKYLPHFPAFPGKMDSGRRIMPYNVQYNMRTPDNSLRKAVPGLDINEPAKWLFPKLPPEVVNNMVYEDFDKKFTYPPPITPRLGPVRPTKPMPEAVRTRPTLTKKFLESTERNIDRTIVKPYVDRDLEDFKEKLLLDKLEAQGIKSDGFRNIQKGDTIKPDIEDYDEDVKGLPVRRRKRDINSKHKTKTKWFTTSPSIETIERLTDEFKGNILLNKLLEIANNLEITSNSKVPPLDTNVKSTDDIFHKAVRKGINKDFSLLVKLLHSSDI